MFFASDNGGPAHPSVLTALSTANVGYMSGYGAEPAMDEIRQHLRDMFDAPRAEVFLVPTGTAANALALASLMQPWQTVFCTPPAHINVDECNAPEFYTGAKLTLVGAGDKMTPDALRAAIEAEETRGVHGPQRGPVSITQVTERGNVYALEELRALTDVAREYGLKVHMDGARFSNAIATLGCSPAEMTRQSGIDVLCFGGTKNGLLGVEAVIFFEPEHVGGFEFLRKRGGHLFSKHRYLSAQMQAYLAGDLWRDLAQRANSAMARLSKGVQASGKMTFLNEPVANILFARAPRAVNQALLDQGAYYYIEEGSLEGDDPDELLTLRLVTDWATTDAAIDQFLEALAKA